MRVSGDSYTIAALDDEHCIGVSVGDVVGHGLPAATATSDLRSALAAASLGLHEPDQVLSPLESYARQVPGGPSARPSPTCSPTPSKEAFVTPAPGTPPRSS